MSAWTDVQFAKPETQVIWKAKQAEGEKARFELLAALRLVFHNDETMLAKIQAINEGGSNDDMIQISVISCISYVKTCKCFWMKPS
jgi:hypothetical protein